MIYGLAPLVMTLSPSMTSALLYCVHGVKTTASLKYDTLKYVPVRTFYKQEGWLSPAERFCNQPKAHFGLLWVRPWDNRGKCHIDEKRIQCLSNASQHVPIYLQLFPNNSTRKFKHSPF